MFTFTGQTIDLTPQDMFQSPRCNLWDEVETYLIIFYCHPVVIFANIFELFEIEYIWASLVVFSINQNNLFPPYFGNKNF